MIHMIAIHPWSAFAVVVFLSLLLALFVGCICRATATHDLPVLIVPDEDMRDVPFSASAAVELSNLGFKVEAWNSDFLQITDEGGITFYMPKNATVEQCLRRHEEKRAQFKVA